MQWQHLDSGSHVTSGWQCLVSSHQGPWLQDSIASWGRSWVLPEDFRTFCCIFQDPPPWQFPRRPSRMLFGDRTDGFITVRTHLPMDPWVWLVAGFEEQALSLEVDVVAGEWFGSLSSKERTLLLVLKELLPSPAHLPSLSLRNRVIPAGLN